MIRRTLTRAIIRSLSSDQLDSDLIKRQLEAFPLSALCAMSEVQPRYEGSRAVFCCGPYSYAIALWQEEYKPQPIQRRHEHYNDAPMVMPDLPAYACPVTGKPITSRSHHRENLKRHGCEVAEPNTPRSTWREDKAEDNARKKAVYDAMQQLNYH